MFSRLFGKPKGVEDPVSTIEKLTEVLKLSVLLSLL